MLLKYRRVRVSYTRGSPIEQAQLVRRLWEWSLHPESPVRGEWRPPTDVYETAAAIVVKAELAGVRERDVEVTLFDDLLVISGERRDEPHGDGVIYHQAGIRYGRFRSEVLLPRSTRVGDGCEARYERGFLYVELPKVRAQWRRKGR